MCRDFATVDITTRRLRSGLMQTHRGWMCGKRVRLTPQKLLKLLLLPVYGPLKKGLFLSGVGHPFYDPTCRIIDICIVDTLAN